MTLLYASPRFLDHDTGLHPENAARLRGLVRHLDEAGLAGQCVRPQWQELSPERLLRVHDADYVGFVRGVSGAGGGDIDADTVVGPGSHEVALLAAGAACDAVERVVRNEDARALCLVRPPGHHALRPHGMGFCLYNNVALAARAAIDDCGLERVLVVDWDVHHGNGTQALFWDDPQVGFFSIHRWPFYPGTGRADETGSGRALGTTVNRPIHFGTTRRAYQEVFAQALQEMAERMRPELILVSAGFDAHRQDPVGNLGLEVEDFAALTRAVLDVAAVHAQGRVVSVLEGGYNPEILAACVAAHLTELLR